MIFVTIGTQTSNFNRLLWEIDHLAVKEKIIVQSPINYNFQNKKIEQNKLLTQAQYDKTLKEARLVITHAGVGSILSALKLHKKIIACPRLSKYGEHINDHQLEIAKYFADKHYILPFYEEDNLSELIKIAQHMHFGAYRSNSKFFLAKLKQEIDNG